MFAVVYTVSKDGKGAEVCCGDHGTSAKRDPAMQSQCRIEMVMDAIFTVVRLWISPLVPSVLSYPKDGKPWVIGN